MNLLSNLISDFNINNSMTCSVYIDYKPCGEPFYVGKGTTGRIKQKERNKFHTAICTKYPDWYRQVVFEGTEVECFAEEMRLIALFGRRDLSNGTLTNLTEGGEGPAGAIRSNETRAKLSSAWKLRKPMTDETRAKLSSAAKLRVHSEETKNKMSTARKGKLISEETKAKLSVAGKLRVHSEETKAKISAAKKGS